MKQKEILVENRKAFTMIELIFVIVVIGILTAIAVPRLAATRDDAIFVKAKNTIAAVRSSISTERQKRILRGDFTGITSLHKSGTGNVFDFYGSGAGAARVLEYPVSVCSSGSTGCWKVITGGYAFVLDSSTQVNFKVKDNRFDCNVTQAAECKDLIK